LIAKRLTAWKQDAFPVAVHVHSVMRY
jgi:hypothetical protein